MGERETFTVRLALPIITQFIANRTNFYDQTEAQDIRRDQPYASKRGKIPNNRLFHSTT